MFMRLGDGMFLVGVVDSYYVSFWGRGKFLGRKERFWYVFEEVFFFGLWED